LGGETWKEEELKLRDLTKKRVGPQFWGRNFFSRPVQKGGLEKKRSREKEVPKKGILRASEGGGDTSFIKGGRPFLK